MKTPASLLDRALTSLRHAASAVDDWLDRRRMQRRAARMQERPVTVVAYPGYIAKGVLHLRGSVLEAQEQGDPGRGGTTLGDLAVTFGRLTATEVMGATVRVRCRGAEEVAETDSDGYFTVAMPVDDAPPPGADERWRQVEVILEDFPGRSQDALHVTAAALEAPAGATLLIISDLDDTVLQTGLADPLRNWRTIIESDVGDRIVFPGLPALYRGLERGGGSEPRNPVCYVSSGSWRLYDLIQGVKRAHRVPVGPILMDDWGLSRDRWIKSSHGAHKVGAIDRLIAAFPGLDVILIGDSGQHDAEIYREAVERHGDRIKAVWIRDVSTSARDAEVEALLADAAAGGRSLRAEPDLLDAARDAAAHGWIDAQTLAEVEAEVAAARGTVA